ncbi:hypothetical protein EMCRGX_G030854 [Ephydatia muelleri]
MAEDELQTVLDLTKKKKKKKKFVLGELESDLHALQAQTEEHEHVEETATEAPEVRPAAALDTTEKAPVPDEDEELKELMNTKKKKKKKKEEEPELVETEQQVPAMPAAADTVEDTVMAEPAKDERSYEVIMDFDLPKKKKKRRTDITFEGFDVAVLETVAALGALDAEQDDDIEMKDGDNMMENEELLETAISTPWVGTERDYTYEELLERVFNIMREKNPNAGGPPKKLVMKPPQVVRVGAKKTSFVNFTEICKFLHRQPKHLLEYLMAELGTSGSVDGNNQLIIKGRFQQKQIETVLRRYIKEYVTCHTCRSPSTILQKETRLFFLQCETCGSRCSVQSIKSGFQAVTGHRAQLRQRQQ